MKAIAETLGVSRSNLAERVKGSPKKRGRYTKEADAELLPEIRSILDGRTTYGYRRVAAVLNRLRAQQGKPLINHKRVYRIMAQNNLLLVKHTGKHPSRPHEGKVITLYSNTRWASDGFEIPCWNKEVVRVTFVIDTCDREIIAWEASTAGFTGESVRNVMVLAVEARFNSHRASAPVEFLTDNGSAYTARETLEFAPRLNLIPCFTPVRSPESNGMAESFVKTFKRDYVFVHDRPDAKTVMAQLDQWFNDYNEWHPHKGLRMKSPRQYIRAQMAAVCPV
jgi:transposase InsO family protein